MTANFLPARNMAARKIAAACLAVLLVTSCQDSPDDPHIAEARNPHSADTFTAQEDTALEAAQEALDECRDATQGACEVVSVDGVAIKTSTALRPSGIVPLLLWRYESDTTVLYLAGSVHALKETLHPFPEPYLSAFQEADAVAVELDVSAIGMFETISLIQRHLSLSEGTVLADALREHGGEDLIPSLHEFGIDPEATDLMPNAVALSIITNRMAILGYEDRLGMENYFLERIDKRTVLELETAEEQMHLLGSAPMPVQVHSLKEALLPLAELDQTITELLRYWLSGNLDGILKLSTDLEGKPPEYAEFNTRLLDDRNITMADKIAGYLERPETIFVMVGTAHIPGPNGVVALLEERGWHGRRLSSDGGFMH